MLPRFLSNIKLALVAGFMAAAAQAQVYIHPDGDTVNAGGFIHVDNWTDGSCLVVIRDGNGNVIEIIILPPEGWVDIPVPRGAGMIGQKITTTAESTTGDKAEKTHRVVR